jgi:hypothetical protein
LRELHLERVQNKPSGFNIGADESMARAMKKAEQMKYSTLLSADNQGSPRDFTKTEYEDVSLSPKKATQTGLLIGEIYLHSLILFHQGLKLLYFDFETRTMEVSLQM